MRVTVTSSFIFSSLSVLFRAVQETIHKTRAMHIEFQFKTSLLRTKIDDRNCMSLLLFSKVFCTEVNFFLQDSTGTSICILLDCTASQNEPKIEQYHSIHNFV